MQLSCLARMGGVSSTPGGRNLTVVNDEAEGAIKVSEDPVHTFSSCYVTETQGQTDPV